MNTRRFLAALLLPLAAACSDPPTRAGTDTTTTVTPPPSSSPSGLKALGLGPITSRYTAELWVRGTVAYTTTWGSRTENGVRNLGNTVYVWNVAGDTPQLVDSLVVGFASTLGDVQVSDDGSLLVVATERSGGTIMIYGLTDPLHPQLRARYWSPDTDAGVHTAEVARVNGKLYAFLTIDTPTTGLVVVDLSNPSDPQQVLVKRQGSPFEHDVFVRDGYLFVALWDAGLSIFDIGGAGRGGSVQNPVLLGNVKTVGGEVHNVWWFQDPQTGSKRYAFVGEEGPATLFSSASGDIHVVDVSDMTAPREVAFYSVPGAGTHNFSMDEARGILYAAYYNGGVRAIDVRGDLGTCTAAQKSADGRCDLAKMGRELATFTGTATAAPVFVWGVQYTGTNVYASDMVNGLWKLTPVVR